MPLSKLTELVKEYEREAETVVYLMYGNPYPAKTNEETELNNEVNIYDHSSLKAVLDGPQYYSQVTKKDQCDLFLATSGGCLATSIKILNRLRETYNTVNIIVPRVAKSCGTLMSFGGHNLYVGDSAVMSDIFPAEKPTGDQALHAVKAIKKVLVNSPVIPNSLVAEVMMIHVLVNIKTDHDSPITFLDFKEILPEINLGTLAELKQRNSENGVCVGKDLMELATSIDKEAIETIKERSFSKLNTFTTAENICY